jgi:hypothetical protein
MQAILDTLSATRVGAEILGNPQGGGTALVGRHAHMANFIVVLHLLSGRPYAALLGDHALVPALEAAVDTGGFHFTVYADSARDRQHMRGLPTRLAAYESLYAGVLPGLRASANLGRSPAPAAVCASAARISVELFCSPLRRVLPWAAGAPGDRTAYMWWFITVAPVYHRHARAAATDLAGMAAQFVCARGLMMAEALQQRAHWHGIMWTAVAVTPAYVAHRLGRRADIFSFEPMRTSPAAAYAYILNQANAVSFWPRDSVAERMRTSQCAFQSRLAERGVYGTEKWETVLDHAVRDGTPWYSMKGVVPDPPGMRTRARLRALSRTVALAVARTWPLETLEYDRATWEREGHRLGSWYGACASRLWAHGMSRWAGQPLILTDTREDYDHACAVLRAGTWAVTHVILISG